MRILRQDIEKLNDKYTRRFTIYDQDDSLRLIKQCIKELGYDEKYLGAARNAIGDQFGKESRRRSDGVCSAR